ncbi:MAG TPA: chemotaxis protein [Thiobacillus sp.]
MNTPVMRLLSGMSVHGDQHLAEVEQDLVQMGVLLDEAIKKLCASFMAIHQAVALQQEALNGMHAAGDEAARFAAIHAEIDRHIGAAVTGLQFQDMTSQLIRRMALHLAGLRDVFGMLNTRTNGSPILPESGSDEILAMLNQIGDQVGHGAGRAGGVRSTVNQRHMESGDIELF